MRDKWGKAQRGFNKLIFRFPRKRPSMKVVPGDFDLMGFLDHGLASGNPVRSAKQVGKCCVQKRAWKMGKSSSLLGNRRKFFAVVGGWGLPWVIRGSVLGCSGRSAPSNRIALGFIGLGMMGRGHLSRFLMYPNVQVIAVCDVDRWRRENAQQMVDKAYGGSAPRSSSSSCAAYNDLRELLDRSDIDAVVIATGDNWHATATVLAAQAGKEVYCEKPASLTIYEAQAMRRAIRRYGRIFQTGLQQRSAPEFRLACGLVQRGGLGKVRSVYVNFPGTSSDVDLPAEPVPEGLDWDRWLGPAPWRPYNSRFHHYGPPKQVVPWHFCRDFGGGNLTSNAVHAFDIVQWALNKDDNGPVEIIPPETGEVPFLTYRYSEGVELQVVPKLDPRFHDIPPDWDENTTIQPFGALFVGEDGWIHVGRQGFLQAYPPDVIETYLARYDHGVALGNHHQDWLQAIVSRRRTASDVESGCRSTIVSHLGCIAHWTGRKLRWDPVREEFVGDEEANRLKRRAMRPPWQV